MTMYDGANNTSTAYATLDATSATAPSPQVITASFPNPAYPPWRLFSQDVVVGALYTSLGQTPQTIMIDIGEGRSAIINKYAMVQPNGWTNKSYNCPKDFVFQGSNTVGCAADDTKNENGWVDLDTRIDCGANFYGVDTTTWIYFTFSSGVSYRFYRFYITDTVGGIASYSVGLSEIKLVAQPETDVHEYGSTQIGPDYPIDGATNNNSSYATSLAISNVLPSPQVISACIIPDSGDGYIPEYAYRVFDRNLATSFSLAGDETTTSYNVMAYLGDEKIINKVIITYSSIGTGQTYRPTNGYIQGSNNPSALVTDAINANNWTDLVSINNIYSSRLVGTYPTWRTEITYAFLNGTAYSKYRFWMTDTTVPYGGWWYYICIDDIQLIEEIRKTTNTSIDSVSYTFFAPVDQVVEINNCAVVVDCIKDTEFTEEHVTSTDTVAVSAINEMSDNVVESSISRAVVLVTQLSYTGDVDLQVSHTDTVSVLDNFDIEQVEMFTTSDTVDCIIHIFSTVFEFVNSLDMVDGTRSHEDVDTDEYSSTTDSVEGEQDFQEGDVAENNTTLDSVVDFIIVIGDIYELEVSIDTNSSHFVYDDDLEESSWSSDVVSISVFAYKNEIITEYLTSQDSISVESSILVQEYLILVETLSAILSITFLDVVELSDSHLVKWNGTKTLTDTFFIYEDIKLQFVKTINEALTLTDSPSAMLEILLSEFILFAESIKANWNTTRTINDGMTLTDSIVQSLQLFITESLVLTDAQVVQLRLELSEFVALAEIVTPNWNTTRTVTDTFDAKDFLYQQLNLILTEALTVTDSAPLCQLGLAIYEYLGFTELLSAPGSFTQGVTDSLDAADSLNFGYSQVINDVFSLVDVADTIRLLLNTVSESLGLSETLTGFLNSTLPVTESLVLADTVASQGRLYNTVYDTLFLNVTVEMNGETWECYVLNTPKFLPSIYTGFNFNSYAVFQNRAYGCKSDGIYELTGDTDNGVVFHTGVQLSETKFGLPNQKRFRKAYIGVSGTTPLLTMETETGETKTYSIDSDGEVDASRVLRSKKWKLTLTDFDQLDFIKLVPVVLAK